MLPNHFLPQARISPRRYGERSAALQCATVMLKAADFIVRHRQTDRSNFLPLGAWPDVAPRYCTPLAQSRHAYPETGPTLFPTCRVS
jgi:hypothetical protein